MKARIRELVEGVLSGEVDRSKASVAFQGFGVYCKIAEQARKERETADLEERLAELEELAALDRRAAARGLRY